MRVVGALQEVSDNVLVATSDVDATNSTVIVGEGNICLVVDPAVKPPELAALAAAIKSRGLRPVAGWSTHAHWDHLLWSSAFGNVPRYATKKAGEIALAKRGKLAVEANKECPGHDLAQLGAVKPLAFEAPTLPWDGPETTVIEHDGHAPGHGALYIKDLGVLVAGDMFSDVEVPTLDLDAAEAVAQYRTGIHKMLGLEGLSHVVPGHGKPCGAAQMLSRVLRDWMYLDDVTAGRQSKDKRLSGAPNWLMEHHRSQAAKFKVVPKA
jgi:glyoxylase-like metal-dependent hydrolase (beta-lactamase superfamily II)